jgi:hypothetical protein
MKPLHLVLGGLGALVLGYIVLKPAEGAGTKTPPALPPGPKVPVTAADLGKTLTVDMSAFKMTSFTNAPGKIQLWPGVPNHPGDLRLLGGSIGANGVFTRVDGSYTFPDGSLAFGSVPPEAVLSIGSILPPSVMPSLPNLTPVGLFPDLAVGDVVMVDAARANVPGVLGGALMKIDMLLSDRNLISAQTYPVKTFSGTIPRDSILSVVSRAGQPFPGVSV